MTNPVTPAGAPVPPTGGGGMPKWLIVVLVFVLVIMLGCCGGFVACHWACQQVVTNGPPALGSYVKDQLKKQGADVDLTGSGVTLPDNFPSDVSVYSGFTARTKVGPPGQNNGMVMFQGKESPDKIGAYYESDLVKKGWMQASASTNGSTVVQQYTKDDLTVSITASGTADACVLEISYQKK